MVATLGLAIAGSALVFNPVTTEAKTTYVTTTTASKKIVALQKKAYKSKKKVSSKTFKFKAKSAGSFETEAYKKAAKLQYGTAYRGKTTTIHGIRVFYATSAGTDTFKVKKIKKGVYSCKITINGKDSTFRREYRNDEARKTMINRITSITKGMNQFDKFYVTACWVGTYAHYWGGSLQMTSDYDFMKGRYKGVCSDMADVLARYAKWDGVKNVGVADSAKDDHAWCYMEVDGTRYYFDPTNPGTPRVTNRKEALEALDYHRTAGLDFANDWYRENIDIEAKDFTNNKAFWDSLTAEQKKAFEKYNGGFNERAKYWLTCDSYSKTELLPAKLFKEEEGIEEKVSKWKHFRF